MNMEIMPYFHDAMEAKVLQVRQMFLQAGNQVSSSRVLDDAVPLSIQQ